MRKKGTIATRILSILLSAAMTATMLPTTAMPVYANEVDENNTEIAWNVEYVTEVENEETVTKAEDVTEEETEETVTKSEGATETETASESSTDEALTVLEDDTSIYEIEENGETSVISSAENLVVNNKLSLGTLTKEEKKWLEFTAPEDGFYMIKTSSNTDDAFECSYYIGAKDATSTALLDFCRTDKEKYIDYANFLGKNDTVYILLEASEEDVSFEGHPVQVISATELGNNAIEAVLPKADGEDLTGRYFYYTAKENLPLVAFEAEYDSENEFVWTLYDLDDVNDKQNYSDLTKLDSSNSTRYMSFPLGNIKKGDSYLIELGNIKGENTNVKLKSIETIDSLNLGSRVKIDDISSARYYAVNITEKGYYYLSNSLIGTGSYGDVSVNLYSDFNSTRGDTVYLQETNSKISHGKLFEKSVNDSSSDYGVSRVFEALDGTAKLTPGTYYLELRNNSCDANNLQKEVKDFTFVFDQVTTISEKKNFRVTLQADTPAVFEYAHEIISNRIFDVETDSAATAIVEIQMRDTLRKKNGSELEAIEGSASGEVYNAFEVVGAASETEATIKCEGEEAVLKDLTDKITSSDKIGGADITKRFEAEVPNGGKKFTFSFAPQLTPEGYYKNDEENSVWKDQENAILFSVNASGAGVDDNFKANHFVRVELYDDQNVMKGYKDLKLDSADTYAKIDKLEEIATYKIKATLYKKTNTSETVLAGLITDSNSKAESGKAFNEVETLGISLIPGTNYVSEVGHTYATLNFQYIDSAVKSVLLSEDGKNYTLAFEIAKLKNDDGSITVHSTEIKPGTTYHMLFLKKLYNVDGILKPYYSEEDIVTPRTDDGKEVGDLCFTTEKLEGKVTAKVDEPTIASDSITLVVKFDGLKFNHTGGSKSDFDKKQLELKGSLKKGDGSDVEKDFILSKWTAGTPADNGARTITAEYTIDGLEEGTTYNISNLKLTYLGVDLGLSPTEYSKDITTLTKGKIDQNDSDTIKISNVKFYQNSEGAPEISFDIENKDGHTDIANLGDGNGQATVNEVDANGDNVCSLGVYTLQTQTQSTSLKITLYSLPIDITNGKGKCNLKIRLRRYEEINEEPYYAYDVYATAIVSDLPYTTSDSSPSGPSTSEYSYAISMEEFYDFRAKMHVNVSRKDGVYISPEDYTLKLELREKITDTGSNPIGKEKIVSGIEADVDTVDFGTLTPNSDYILNTTLVKNEGNTPVDTNTYTFATRSADLTNCITVDPDSIGNSSVVVSFDLSQNTNARDAIVADKERSSKDKEVATYHFDNIVYYYVKEKDGQSQPTHISGINSKSYAEPFTITVSGLKPNTDYVVYAAHKGDGEQYSTPISFTTLNETMEIIPSIDLGFDKALFKADIKGRSETDLKYYGWDFYYRKSGGGEWTLHSKYINDSEYNMPKVEYYLDNLSEGTEYDYVLIITKDKSPDNLDQNLEYLKSIYKDNEYVLIKEKGFKTKNSADYELDPSIKVPGELPVTFTYDKSKDETTNTIKLKFSVPGWEKTIKAVAEVAEMDDKGGFKEYSQEDGKNKIAEAYFSSQNDFEGEFIFENLEKNTSYYLKGINVYVNELSGDTGFETHVGTKSDYTINFGAPEKSLMFVSGTTKLLRDFEVTGLKDLQTTDSVERGYDGVQSGENPDVYIVAYDKKGDRYELKLKDSNGKDIGNVSSVFDLKIEDSKVARIVSDGGVKHIELLRTGETKLVITPKSNEKYKLCGAKEITLRVCKAPSIPESAEIYALTGVQKKLSDINLQSYGFDSVWEWKNPDTLLSTNHTDKVTAEGDERGYCIGITDDASKTYYPIQTIQKVKLREFKNIDICFIDKYVTGNPTEEKRSAAQISDDGKTAVVPLSTPEKENGALVGLAFNYYGQGTDDELYTYYEWEALPADVKIDKLPDQSRENQPTAKVNQFSISGAYKDGLKLKLSAVYAGHYNGDKFVRDVDLISEKVISEKDLENCALTLYSSNDAVVSRIEINEVDTSNPEAEPVTVSGNGITFNAENFDGEVVHLKPVFYDANDNIIPSSEVKYSFVSSDAKIASVDSAADEYGTHKVEIKKKVGSAALTLKVNDGVFDRSTEVGVRIIDFTPLVSTKAVTVNTAYDFDSVEGKKLATKTDTPIEIVPVYGTKITSIMFSDTATKDSEGKYFASSDVDYFYGEKTNQLFVIPKEGLKKANTYYMIVQVESNATCDLSHSATYSFPIKVTPKNNKVKASVKTVDKYNYFFTDAKGKLALTLKGVPYLDSKNNAFGATSNKGEQAEFTWVDDANSAQNKGFSLSIDASSDGNKKIEINEKNGSYTYNVSFGANNLDVENKKIKDNKITSGVLTLYLKGYKEPVTLKVKLPVKYKKPTLKIYSETIVSAIGKNDGKFVIIDENKNVYGYNGKLGDIEKSVSYNGISSTNDSFTLTHNAQISNIAFTKNGKDIDWIATKTDQKFTYNGSKRIDSTKLTLNSNNWREKLEVTLKVKSQTPYIKFEKGEDKVTFNTAFESEYCSQLDTNLSDEYLSDLLGDITADKYTIVPSNNKAEKLLSSQLLTFVLCKDKINDHYNEYYIRCNIERLADEDGIKPGKYTYRITPKTNGSSSSLKPFKYVITITNKTPKVVYQKKGNVDNLAIDMTAFANMLNKSKSSSAAISSASKYACVLVPKLVNYPSGSEVDEIRFSGDYMNESLSGFTNIFESRNFINPNTNKYSFTYLCANARLKSGDRYEVKARARVKIGSGDSYYSYQYEKENHEFAVKVSQGKPKISVVKQTDGNTLYKALAGKKVSFKLNTPDAYSISDVYGKLDINKDGITDVEVKAEFKNDGSVRYLYGVLCEGNSKLNFTKKKISVPVTVKFKGRDGIIKDSVVKVSFVIVP